MLGFGSGRKNVANQPQGSAQGGQGPQTSELSRQPQGMPDMQMQGMQGGQMGGEDQEYINRRIAEIDAQAQEFARKNPEFDMKQEIQNSDFCNYVWGNGLSVEDAYFLAHKEELLKKAQSDVMNSLSARRGRIAENGAGRNTPAVAKKNPKDMSDDEVDNIIERVRKGEKISF